MPLLVGCSGVFTETVIKEVISETITTKEMWVVIGLNYRKETATAHRLLNLVLFINGSAEMGRLSVKGRI